MFSTFGGIFLRQIKNWLYLKTFFFQNVERFLSSKSMILTTVSQWYFAKFWGKARTSERSLVIQLPWCHLKIQWNPTGNSMKFHWQPVKIYWKPVELHWMTSATALKFPVAPGSLELTKKIYFLRILLQFSIFSAFPRSVYFHTFCKVWIDFSPLN